MDKEDWENQPPPKKKDLKVAPPTKQSTISTTATKSKWAANPQESDDDNDGFVTSFQYEQVDEEVL